MSETLRRIQRLAAGREIRISSHGYDELAADGILATEVIEGIAEALVVEDYPDYAKARAFWFSSAMRRAGRSTPFGASPGVRTARPSW